MPKSIANKFYKNVKQFSFIAAVYNAPLRTSPEKNQIITMILLNKYQKRAVVHASAASRRAKNKH
ncbi:hypothetical protein [Serratia rubidaea]|uniref:hypothetical protein n=1 Tax=Serratia rubidaea TaxID=61652 RepID=UPI000B12358A|nr:hypothetical protein [Serratia rubidaea]MCR0997954.1 hypothetical protein [Serratia rubidaea]QPR62990.1 hypothetical protein I6G83_19635 [Serratia rubidaea]HAY0636418.1 hypothetical protein [Serratia rubidaea]